MVRGMVEALQRVFLKGWFWALWSASAVVFTLGVFGLLAASRFVFFG